MLRPVLLAIALVFSLILPAWVAGASATMQLSDDYAIISAVDSPSLASTMALNTLQGQITPMVAAGGSHTVGLKADGTAIAMGSNAYRQCNVGNWTDIIQVAAGMIHTVGLKADGTVVAAGSNYHSECHIDGSIEVWDGKCDVGGWTDIIQVAAGYGHTVGLKADGTVVAVGNNYYGQCDVGGWTDIVQVAAGRGHTVGLKSDGTVVAVGGDAYYYGQCDVGGWTDIVQVAAAEATVGLKADGTVVAMGGGFYGQCDVGGWVNIVQIAAGYHHTTGLKADGTVVAVGHNGFGQCDVGSWTDIVQVAAGIWHTVGLKPDGTVIAVGQGDACDVSGWTDIIQVAAGGWHTVGLKSDGSVVAVGMNNCGQCDVVGWMNIIKVSAGDNHTVGLKTDGTVAAVGYNNRGQCTVGGWTDIIQVAAGYEYTAGLKSNGRVVAAGRDFEWQCNVGDWTDIVQVNTRHLHTLGLKIDGTMVAVGDNSWGQCNVGGCTDIVQVAGGARHTLGLRSDGTVVVAGPEVELAKILLLIKASLHSPAEFRIYDSQGHVTGVVDGEVRDEILWATLNQQDESITILYGFDTYFYEVEGISNGSYGLTMDVVNEGQTTTFSAIDVPITPGAIHRYHIDWYALSEGEPGITIEMDHDGDGEVDEIIITGIPEIPTNPSPVNSATDVSLDAILSWVGDDSDTITYNVYFGTGTNPPLVSERQAETSYAPTLNPGTTYYWGVEPIDEHWEFWISSVGPLWEFTTEEAPSLCFIATAAYGTPMGEEVQILREFRDEYLLTNSVGRAFVDFYYRVSPPIAQFITEHPSLKPIVRVGLLPAVSMSAVAVNITPTEKMVIVGLLVLVSVALAIWTTRRRGRGPQYS